MQQSNLVEGHTSTLPPNVVKTALGYETKVTYYPGKSVLGGLPAILRWHNGQITMIRQPKTEAEQPVELFSLPANQLKQVGRYETVLAFHTPHGIFKAEFNYKAGLMIGAGRAMRGSGGAVGSAAGRQMSTKPGMRALEDSGYFWWVNNLSQAGVKLAQPKLLTWILIGLGLLFVVIILMPK